MESGKKRVRSENETREDRVKALEKQVVRQLREFEDLKNFMKRKGLWDDYLIWSTSGAPEPH